MRTIHFFSIIAMLILSISILNAQSSNQTINGTYMGVNDDYNYVFKLDNGTQMEFHEIVYELEEYLIDESINKKFKVTFEEEVITEEEYEEDSNTVNPSDFTYRKIIGLKEI
jgi:hypothetical protein